MDFLKDATGTEIAFWVFAVFGSMFFILRVLMMVIGGFGSEEIDADVDFDANAPNSGAHHSARLAGTDPAFKLLSINSVTGFFMMFGWAGLSAYKQFGLGSGQSFGIALVAGLITMLITSFLLRYAMRLQSPGACLDLKEAIGRPGSVYLKIPKDGRGKIKLSLGGASRIIDAISRDGTEIDSFKNIEIVKVIDGQTVEVKPAGS